MNFYTWLTINEDRIAEQEIMLGRPLRRAQLEHLYHLEYPDDHTTSKNRRANPHR